MIKSAEKRGKVHTTPIAEEGREEELRQAQGPLVVEGRKEGRRKGAMPPLRSFVYLCASERERRV